MTFHLQRRRRAGFAVLMVMVLMGASLLMLGGVLRWSQSNASLAQRNNQYHDAVVAASAATEKVFTRISTDFQALGEPYVYGNLASYRALVPTVSENSYWSNFGFTDAQGHSDKTYVERLTSWAYTNLQTKFTGLSGNAATYRIISNARRIDASNTSVSAVEQDVQLASIPVFEYQIFYAPDLEIQPGGTLNLSGRVHSNGSIYSERNLTFKSHVTAGGKILNYKHPNDPTSRGHGTFTFQGEHVGGVNSLNLPLGTNNTSAALHSIIEVPPPGEPTNSLMGLQRFYNKADLIILVSDTNVVTKSGAYNGFATNIPWSTVNPFLATNVTFFSKRENKTILTTEFDVQHFNSQYGALVAALGRNPKCVYVADQRTQSANTQSGVRLVNGETLPSAGLTVATVNPLYVVGHYNAPPAYRGTTNTTTTFPAAVVADAITILSPKWRDNNSGSDLSTRDADNTTVNAAILAGIVPSGGGYYSGGVENLTRHLENWSGNTFTYNGSMVVLFNSQTATAPWGATSDVYNPPTRNWSFDLNFLNPAKLPTGTPEVRTTIRAKWTTLQAGATQ